ncbi:MAG: CRISPR-associated endonuclease Cas3'' [Candidatus Dormibacteraceae bacterium]
MVGPGANLAPLLYAHSRAPAGYRHELAAHLTAVSKLAETFAEPLGAKEFGAAVGAWHDLGKASPEFQEYLCACEIAPGLHARGPDHKSAGAAHALRRGVEPLAMLIQGHHGGLPNLAASRTWLRERIVDGDQDQKVISSLLDSLSEDYRTLLDIPVVPLPKLSEIDAEMFLRLLFSCLVDADGLDTESHFNPDLSRIRTGAQGSMESLDSAAVGAHASRFQDAKPTLVNRIRAEIYDLAMQAADERPGLFRLAVPTGGGKTITGMSFATRHALKHGLGRIVVAVPFTSITEQTASVYRSILGITNVIEHHSALDPAALADQPPLTRLWSRLAADNWDAPVIVTTTVRLFESLLGNRVSDSRRLHRLARAVVIVDETQALPVHVLEPAMHVLQQLVTQYGSTVVLSTATQPQSEQPALAWLSTARDIVPQPDRFLEAMRRVNWELAGEWDHVRVAAEIAARPQVMAILNTRKDAIRVLGYCPVGTFHLSTLLCGAHRRKVLAEVRRRLAAGLECRLVSTQVVEAGVDVDLPVVLRAMAPLDSIIQAAGRCNREGSLDRGLVVVFEGGGHPPGPYRIATDTTRSLIARSEQDFDDPKLVGDYFRALFRNVNLDKNDVQLHRRTLAYEEVARRFRMIEDDGIAVVVRYGDGERLAMSAAARQDPGRARQVWRALQPFTVNLRKRELEWARGEGWVHEEAQILIWTAPYDEVLGVGGVLMEAIDDQPAT